MKTLGWQKTLERPRGKIKKETTLCQGGCTQKFYTSRSGNFLRTFSPTAKVNIHWYKQNPNFTKRNGDFVSDKKQAETTQVDVG